MPRPRIDLRAIVRLDSYGIVTRFSALQSLVVNEWGRQARGTLGKTSRDYISGIRPGDVTRNGFIVELVGTVPNLVENGMGPGGIGTTGPYDMRKFILKPGTRNLRRDSKGRLYVNIPLEHSAASIGMIGGAGALQEARLMRPARTRHGDFYRPPDSNLVDPRAKQARTKWGDSLGAEYGDRLRGLVRMEKVYSKATAQAPQTKFMTWRRMTEGGKGWMSKGVTPRLLARAVHRKSGELIRSVGL